MAADPLSDFVMNNGHRLDQISKRLGSYQPQAVDREVMRAWLRQFDPADFDLVLRVLETVQFYGIARLQQMMFELHRAIKVRLAIDGYRGNDNLIYLPLGETAASGQQIISMFRNINKIWRTTASLAQSVELPDLLYEAEKDNRTLVLVFLDDFIGTGATVCDFWAEILQQLGVRRSQPLYIATAVACEIGMERIQNETPFQIIPLHIVQPRHLLLDSDQFTAEEKARVVNYCAAVGNPPLGIGGLGALVAFAHGAPNNTLAILRGSKRQGNWVGILPRYEDLP